MPEMPVELSLFDSVLQAARQSGIDAKKVEIRPASRDDGHGR